MTIESEKLPRTAGSPPSGSESKRPLLHFTEGSQGRVRATGAPTTPVSHAELPANARRLIGLPDVSRG